MRSSVEALPSAGLHRFAVLTAAATLGLVGIGGLVTSHGVGMAVPDWPNTYGYNMFFFPVSKWVGGILYEHTHRLVASGVGLLTTILALWLYGRSARPFMRWAGVVLIGFGLITWLGLPGRWSDAVVLGVTGLALLGGGFVWPCCAPAAKWLRWLGLVAFFAVVLQGVLGGLRVVLYKDAIGIFHAALAQLFFVLVCAIALFTSRWWQGQGGKGEGRGASFGSPGAAKLHWWFAATTGLIFCQLVLGAALRHQHAGLAIPDFPLAYGRLWPAMDPASVASYNQHRIEVLSANPITAFQILLQMVHRLVAVMILGAVAFCAWSARRQGGFEKAPAARTVRSRAVSAGPAAAGPAAAGPADTAALRRLPGEKVIGRLALFWLGLIGTQVLLGAATIWSGKAADIATAHVLIGALSLATGVIVSIISSHALMLACRVTDSPPPAKALVEPPLAPRPHFGLSSHTT